MLLSRLVHLWRHWARHGRHLIHVIAEKPIRELALILMMVMVLGRRVTAAAATAATIVAWCRRIAWNQWSKGLTLISDWKGGRRSERRWRPKRVGEERGRPEAGRGLRRERREAHLIGREAARWRAERLRGRLSEGVAEPIGAECVLAWEAAASSRIAAAAAHLAARERRLVVHLRLRREAWLAAEALLSWFRGFRFA